MTVEGARVTRAERQAQTRESLIAVAREMFLSDGYAATSLDKVAVRAGFSKGAVYSNFAGKDELFYALMTVRPERSSNVSPSSRSKLRICALTPG